MRCVCVHAHVRAHNTKYYIMFDSILYCLLANIKSKEILHLNKIRKKKLNIYKVSYKG